MEKYGSLQIVGASMMALVFFFFIILPVLYWTLSTLFSPKMKIIKGKIIRIRKKEISIWVPDQPGVSADLNSYNLGSSTSGRFIDISDYSIFWEEEKNHQKYFIPIPKEVFDDLQEKNISSLKHISLFFKKYFLWGETFNHLEIA